MTYEYPWARKDNMNTTTKKFDLGMIAATPGALEALQANTFGVGQVSEIASHLIDRHVRGDWGTVDAADRAANDAAVHDGTRILSAYKLPDGTKLWIITEADRSATTLLLPEEY